MNKRKQMRALFASLLAITILISSVPVITLADTNIAVCTCTKACVSDRVNEACEACTDGQYVWNCSIQEIPYLIQYMEGDTDKIYKEDKLTVSSEGLNLQPSKYTSAIIVDGRIYGAKGFQIENEQGETSYTSTLTIPAYPAAGDEEAKQEWRNKYVDGVYLYYQSGNGMVEGVVKTTNGTPVAGHTVSLREKDSDETIETVTDGKGKYRLDNLPDEDFEVTLNEAEKSISISISNGKVVGDSDLVVSATEIPGAGTSQVSTTDGNQMEIEFIPTGESTVGSDSTLVVSDYEWTGADIVQAGSTFLPQGLTRPAETATPDEQAIITASSYVGKSYQVGDLIEIKSEKYIVDSGMSSTDPSRPLITLTLYNLSNKKSYIWYGGEEPENQNFSPISITEDNYMIRIDGAAYNVRYIIDDPINVGTEYYMYVPVTGESAGKYRIGKTGKVTAYFNKGYDPSSIKENMKKGASIVGTVGNSSGTRYDMLTLISSDISIPGVSAGTDGTIGTFGIKVTDDDVNSADDIKGIHSGAEGYDLATVSELEGGGYNASWLVSDTSPFMVFVFAENKTDIPVRTVEITETTPTITPTPTPTPTPTLTPTPTPTTTSTPSTTSTNVKSPNTGDETNVIIWFILALISGSGAATISRRYRKKYKT